MKKETEEEKEGGREEGKEGEEETNVFRRD